MTQTEPPHSVRATKSKTLGKDETSESVSKVEEGAFINLTSAIQSIHLSIWITIPKSGTLRQESIALTDERALVHAAGRLFSKGAAEDAMKQIKQAQSGFNRKKAEWERRVRQSEDDSARRRAMRELQQKKSYHNPITSRISPAENQFRRLVEALDIHVTLERKRVLSERHAASQSASPVVAARKKLSLPSGFMEAFGKAEAEGKEAVIKQFFDVEAELSVEVTSADSNQLSVTFSPPLPKNRLYYLVDTAQVIRLRRVKITSDVFYHDCVTDKSDKMPLQSVIECVQAGSMWLLRPKSASK